MNTLTKSEIWARVEEDYKKLERDFPNSRILCTFVIGKVNSENAMVSSDIDTVSIIFPTIENIALNGGYVRNMTYHKTGGRQFVIDFRSLYNNIIGMDVDIDNLFELLFTEYILVNPLYKKVCDRLPRVWPQEDADEYADLIQEGILGIFNQYLTMRDGIQEKLFSSLTKTEEKALIFVLETIGECGNLSISEAINKSGISRPVFTSLFDKLDRYKGAEIKNQGVKGTYINFYDHVLSAFNIE
jgi:hypothetical protein